MKPRTFAMTSLAFTLALAGSTAPLASQVDDPDPERFAEQFEEFATWDAENFVPEDGIVFIGSSSINYWRTAEAFPGLPVINRGFGGSQASDVVRWAEEGVLAYDPAVVVYYEGDNDTSVGKKADQIFEDMHEFVHAVHSSGSDTQIVFLSVKPSPARMGVWEEAKATNALLESFAASHDDIHYVDVGSDLLDTDGQPIPEYFVEDGIHMTPAGYEVWNEIMGHALAEILH